MNLEQTSDHLQTALWLIGVYSTSGSLFLVLLTLMFFLAVLHRFYMNLFLFKFVCCLINTCNVLHWLQWYKIWYYLNYIGRDRRLACSCYSAVHYILEDQCVVTNESILCLLESESQSWCKSRSRNLALVEFSYFLFACSRLLFQPLTVFSMYDFTRFLEYAHRTCILQVIERCDDVSFDGATKSTKLTVNFGA